MRRKLLEGIEPIELSQEMGNEVFAVEAQLLDIADSIILELDIYRQNQDPSAPYLLCRHFISKEKSDYETLFLSEEYHPTRIYKAGEWSKMKYETIIKEGDYYWKDNKVTWSKEAEETVKNYYNDAFSANSGRIIEQIEYHISQERQGRAIESKARRISLLMAQVEPLGEDFKDWIKEIVFPNRYIFASAKKLKRGYKCYCATCGEMYYSKEKIKHNQQIECPKCGQKTITKTRVQQITEKESILVMQKFQEDKIIIRHFRAERTAEIWNGKAEDNIFDDERIRIIFAEGGKARIYYPTAGRHIEGYEWWDERHSTVTDKDFYMYPKGIAETPINVCLKNTLLAAAQAGEKMDYNNLIRCWRAQPYLEYLIKGKLYKLADEIIRDYGYWSKPDKLLDLSGKSISKLLKVNKQRTNRLREVNGGKASLQALQMEERDNTNVTQENLKWINENDVNINELLTDLTLMKPNRALNYIRRQMDKNKMKFDAMINYYKDYLDMAAGRGMDITDDIVRATPKMIEYHNAYLEEKNRIENEQRYQEVNEKYQNIKNQYLLNQELYEYENDDYIIMAPKEAADIVKEGQLQHHCVGAADGYINSMDKGISLILFLRRQQEPDIPYYTIQAKPDGKVIQRHAAYNRDPDAKAVDRLLKEWKKELTKREKASKELLAAI